MPHLYRAFVLLALTGALALAGACGGGGANGPLSLTANKKSVPADGLSKITVSANASDAPPGSVVVFTIEGVGLLGNTNVEVVNGSASVDVYAPFESELGAQAAASSTVVATMQKDKDVLTARVGIAFTVATDGAPSLSAHAEPDRVIAGGADPITLVVDGRRLASGDVTLHADSTAITLPSTMTLASTSTGVFHGELAIDPAAAPADVNVTISAPGADDVVVALHFVTSDAPAYDLTGTFAEVQYGVVEIGGLIFLSPDPQCVIAPTLLLSTVVQSGDSIEITSTTCDVQMPSVSVVIVGQSTTTVGPGFVDATNAANPGPLEVPLTQNSLPAPFAPTQASFGAPLIVGASLASPTDALPTTGDDPRVTDGDHDGNPGVTVHNSTEGDQFTLFRSTTSSMTGTITSSDAVDGSVSGITETNILNGGSGGISPTVTGKASPFSFRRVDGRNGAVDISGRDGDPSSISCDDINAYAAELEALAPPPDTSTACN